MEEPTHLPTSTKKELGSQVGLFAKNIWKFGKIQHLQKIYAAHKVQRQGGLVQSWDRTGSRLRSMKLVSSLRT